jgi:hypothetical protein
MRLDVLDACGLANTFRTYNEMHMIAAAVRKWS